MIRAYLRVSTDKQADSGLGIEGQRRAIESKYPGARIEWYRDEAESGAKPALERPEFGRLVHEMQSGDLVVVAKLDRLTRAPSDYYTIEYLFKRQGVTLVSAAGDGTEFGNDPMGELTRGLFVLMAQYERRLIQLRVRSAMKVLKQDGYHAGRVSPLSTVSSRRVRRDGSQGAGKVTYDEAILDELRGLRAQGLGWVSLAKHATERMQRPVTASAVRYALGAMGR